MSYKLLLVFVLAIGIGFGCAPAAEEDLSAEAKFAALFEQDEIERDSVLALVAQASSNSFKEAFLELRNYHYTRYSRTDQFDDDDFQIAFRERTVEHLGPLDSRRYNVLSSDSSGSYDFGFFRHFVSATVEEQDPEDLTPYLFPEDPSYLSARNYEAYLYHFRRDTLMLNTSAKVAEIRAKPVAGDGKNIRRARFYFDQSSGRFIAFELERIDLAMFFREESRFFVHLQNSPDGKQIPYNTRFETRITMPFKLPQVFRTVATYYDVSS
ncbi:MAG: hypothetical protein AB8G77_17770 [Rhodothermales bacterium]